MQSRFSVRVQRSSCSLCDSALKSGRYAAPLDFTKRGPAQLPLCRCDFPNDDMVQFDRRSSAALAEPLLKIQTNGPCVSNRISKTSQAQTPTKPNQKLQQNASRSKTKGCMATQTVCAVCRFLLLHAELPVLHASVTVLYISTSQQLATDFF